MNARTLGIMAVLISYPLYLMLQGKLVDYLKLL